MNTEHNDMDRDNPTDSGDRSSSPSQSRYRIALPSDVECNTKLFVGSVGRECTQAILKAAFEQFGSIHECLLLKDRGASYHRGCGFVIYKTREQSETAIKNVLSLREHHPSLRNMEVRFADNVLKEFKLFIGSIPADVEDVQKKLSKILEQYGEVLEVHMIKSTNTTKLAAFARFKKQADAERAISCLDHMPVFGDGSTITVRYAESDSAKRERKKYMTAAVPLQIPAALPTTYLQYPATTVMVPFHTYPIHTAPPPPSQRANHGPRGCNLFVKGLPLTMTDNELYKMFNGVGHVLSVRINTDKTTGRSRGFAFVSYSNPNDAAEAIRRFDRRISGDQEMRVEIKNE